jgi:hypothetical protein
MIVGGLKSSLSRRRYRNDSREVQLINTKPSQPLRWSEQPITFSRADHWVHIPDHGLYPLVVEPIIEGALLPQTLIDGGNGLNVIYVDTLKKMDFDFKRLTECDEPFFGIVPGKAAYPMVKDRNGEPESGSRPRSHWSATDPRNQQTTFRAKTHQHTQRKLARLAACATPGRPIVTPRPPTPHRPALP